jgi:hypothetical protein
MLGYAPLEDEAVKVALNRPFPMPAKFLRRLTPGGTNEPATLPAVEANDIGVNTGEPETGAASAPTEPDTRAAVNATQHALNQWKSLQITGEISDGASRVPTVEDFAGDTVPPLVPNPEAPLTLQGALQAALNHLNIHPSVDERTLSSLRREFAKPLKNVTAITKLMRRWRHEIPDFVSAVLWTEQIDPAEEAKIAKKAAMNRARKNRAIATRRARGISKPVKVPVRDRKVYDLYRNRRDARFPPTGRGVTAKRRDDEYLSYVLERSLGRSPEQSGDASACKGIGKFTVEIRDKALAEKFRAARDATFPPTSEDRSAPRRTDEFLLWLMSLEDAQ